MKKILLPLAVLLLFMTDSYAQATFNTGTLEVSVNQYGRIRLFDADGVRHLQRASVLVGTPSAEVFDYTNDAEELDPTALVENPLLSDFEIYGSCNNAYSSLPPDVIVKYYAYGWNNGAYTIVKFNITNNETGTIDATAGLEVIPEINQEYGFDSVTYNDEAHVVRFHRGNQVNMGIKLLSASLTSLYSFEWYDGYTVDADLWTWMNYGSLQPLYASETADGPVSITAQAPVNIAPGESYEVFYAFSIGANEQEMLAGITSAGQKYDAWFAGVADINPSKGQSSLGQNYPNPFRNETTIAYQLPVDGFVRLQVFDAAGNEVETLVNSMQPSGSYVVEFNADDLAGGMYFYTLNCNDRVESRKMFIVK